MFKEGYFPFNLIFKISNSYFIEKIDDKLMNVNNKDEKYMDFKHCKRVVYDHKRKRLVKF
jgi:hypothetical protein